jgi:hypothetical protein
MHLALIPLSSAADKRQFCCSLCYRILSCAARQPISADSDTATQHTQLPTPNLTYGSRDLEENESISHIRSTLSTR